MRKKNRRIRFNTGILEWADWPADPFLSTISSAGGRLVRLSRPSRRVPGRPGCPGRCEAHSTGGGGEAVVWCVSSPPSGLREVAASRADLVVAAPLAALLSA